MSQVFLTGATGYLGGQVLRELSRSLPDLKISALVRDSSKSQIIQQAFPNVRVILGDLDDVELLEREATQAHIVLHLAATSHLKSTQAIHRGLEKAGSAPTFWIQISGASALAAGELASATFTSGDASSAVFDDLSGVAEIRDLIRAHSSRAVDNYILDVASEQSSIKTALVFPPIIYGEGEGAVNTRSIQLPSLAHATLEKGHGIRVGKGLSIWGDVHIRDVGRIFGALVQEAQKGNASNDLWGENGIYLTGVGETTFGEISSKVAHAAKELGLIHDDSVEQLSDSAANEALPKGAVLFGTNARSNARRAKELLNWKPQEGDLSADISRSIIEEDARRKQQNVN